MKVKAILICASLALGLLFASCSSSSKTCPAYSNADTNTEVEVAG